MPAAALLVLSCVVATGAAVPPDPCRVLADRVRSHPPRIHYPLSAMGLAVTVTERPTIGFDKVWYIDESGTRRGAPVTKAEASLLESEWREVDPWIELNKSSLQGSRWPTLAVQSSGGPVSLDGPEPGKRALIVQAWRAYCLPCRRQLEANAALLATAGLEDAVTLASVCLDDAAKCAAALDALPRSTRSSISEFRVDGAPPEWLISAMAGRAGRTYLVDTERNVISSNIEPSPAFDPVILALQLQRILCVSAAK